MDDDYEYEVQPWELSDDSSGYGNLLDMGWSISGSTWTDPSGESFDLSYLDPGLAGEVTNFLKSAPKSVWNAFKSAFTNKQTGELDWRALATAAGGLYGAFSGSESRPTGYQGGIPEYTAVREAVPQVYDPNRRPGSGGQRYFTDVQYLPKTGEGAAEALTAAQTGAIEQAQGLASLNAANPYNAPPQEREVKTMARGGIVGLQDGGFVVPADVVSHLGNGSSRAGINHLARKGAMPIQGRGDGMSDSNRTTINGRQPAAVADGEAYFPPKQVENMGGADRLYAMMDKIRKDRTGTTKQGKQINPNQYV